MESELNECLDLTKHLMEKPLNFFFCQVPKYSEKFYGKPSNYKDIKSKLDKQQYTSIRDWYYDVFNIYSTALSQYDKDSIQYSIAEYALKDFQKESFKLYDENNAWYNKLLSKIQKLVTTINQSPIPQGIDPVIFVILKKGNVNLTPEQIKETMSRLNFLMSNQLCRYEIRYILSQTQEGLLLSQDTTLDSDKLTEKSLSALFHYSQAKYIKKI